jgi:hypothetical protein
MVEAVPGPAEIQMPALHHGQRAPLAASSHSQTSKGGSHGPRIGAGLAPGSVGSIEPEGYKTGVNSRAAGRGRRLEKLIHRLRPPLE